MELDLSKKYYEGIGRISTAFSELETCLFYSIMALMEGNNSKSALVILPLNIQSRINVLKALSDYINRGDERAKELDDIIKNVSAVVEKRNKIIHGYHGPIPGNDSEVRFQKMKVKRKGLIAQDESISTLSLYEISEELWSLHQRIINFVSKMYRDEIIIDDSNTLKKSFIDKESH